MTAPPRRWFPRLPLGCYVAVAIVVVPIAMAWWVGEGHGAALSRVARIHRGMTSDDVSGVLGRPTTKYESLDHEQWVYSRMTWCCIRITFDSHGHVEDVEHDH
jgi:hypothetical protein